MRWEIELTDEQVEALRERFEEDLEIDANAVTVTLHRDQLLGMLADMDRGGDAIRVESLPDDAAVPGARVGDLTVKVYTPLGWDLERFMDARGYSHYSRQAPSGAYVPRGRP